MRTLLLVILLWAGAAAWCEVPTHTIGILVQEGEPDAAGAWEPTAEYLAASIPGHAFVIVPLRREALTRAVANDDLDFAITHAGHYVELAVRFGMVARATMQRVSADGLHSNAGAAIIARADRADITWMSDLKGKSFMAVARDSFCGFQLAWWELRSHDIDPATDFSRLVFSGAPAERIVEAVRDGTIDSAAVRTDVLARMVSEGSVDASALRVLHPRPVARHAAMRSTDLYPEWAFASGRHTPSDLAERVGIALQGMSVAHPAARAGGYAGWAAAADYGPVHEVLRDLHLPPYETAAHMTVVELAHRHWTWIAGGALLVLLMAGMLVYLSRLSYRLNASRRAVERARALEARMAHVGRLAAMGEMSTTLAHELNQPLAAIVNYANGTVRRLQADELAKGDLLNVLQRIASEGNRSAEIIRRLREFLTRRNSMHVPEDVNRIVREAVELLQPAARRKRVSLRLVLASDLPRVLVDAVQIEQVVVNLVRNAIEAIDGAQVQQREVVVSTERNQSRGVDVTVRDTGPGLPPQLATGRFEPFVSTKQDGMGLGLCISHSIVEAHGDRLRVVPAGRRGAAFRFTLFETERSP